MKNQKKNMILFPAAAFAFICVRLGTIEFRISRQEYRSLAISLIIPFLLFYIVEIIRCFGKNQKESMPDRRDLVGAVILLLLGIFYLFSLCSASNPAIEFV